MSISKFLKNCYRSLSSPQQSIPTRLAFIVLFKLPIVYFLLSSFFYRVFIYSIISITKNFSSSRDGKLNIVVGRAILLRVLCVVPRVSQLNFLTSFLRVVRGWLHSPAWRHVCCVLCGIPTAVSVHVIFVLCNDCRFY